jgi:hypothetical protein
MYRTLEFGSTFPNEWKFDANEAPVAPGAKELADAIARELSKYVKEVTPVSQHSYFGWAFDVNFAGWWFFNVLNPADARCYLTIHLPWCWLRGLTLQRPRQRFDEYCRSLEQALMAIPQVSEIVWQSSAK